MRLFWLAINFTAIQVSFILFKVDIFSYTNQYDSIFSLSTLTVNIKWIQNLNDSSVKNVSLYKEFSYSSSIVDS